MRRKYNYWNSSDVSLLFILPFLKPYWRLHWLFVGQNFCRRICSFIFQEAAKLLKNDVLHLGDYTWLSSFSPVRTLSSWIWRISLVQYNWSSFSITGGIPTNYLLLSAGTGNYNYFGIGVLFSGKLLQRNSFQFVQLQLSLWKRRPFHLCITPCMTKVRDSSSIFTLLYLKYGIAIPGPVIFIPTSCIPLFCSLGMLFRSFISSFEFQNELISAQMKNFYSFRSGISLSFGHGLQKAPEEKPHHSFWQFNHFFSNCIFIFQSNFYKLCQLQYSLLEYSWDSSIILFYLCFLSIQHAFYSRCH